MTEGEWNKGDEEYEGLSFVNDPFALRHSTSGRFLDAESIFKTQLEQTPDQSDQKGLTQRSLLAKRIAFQRF
jgi:hypothetical protein